MSPRLASRIGGSALLILTSLATLGTSGAPSGAQAERTQVLFSFHVRGFPNEPDDKHLPENLAAVELRTKGTRLLSVPNVNTYEPEGKILVTTIYRGQAAKVVEREVVLRPFGNAGYFEDDSGERAVGGRARVSVSNDRKCREGVTLQFFFGGALAGEVHPGRAIVRFGSAAPGAPLDCLTGLTDDESILEWNAPRYFESAEISRPKPVN